MVKANYSKHTLLFRQPAGTSRGVYIERDSWFIRIYDTENPEISGIGECAPLPGLSPELNYGFLDKLREVCKHIERYNYPVLEDLASFSSIRMGLESALLDFQRKMGNPVFLSDFTEGKTGVKINGLIWLGKPDFMRKQIKEKIDQGYSCLKLKIGAIDFSTELSIINNIRKKYTQAQIQIRVDANGAFSPDEAMIKLEALAKYGIHSIEQPIPPGNIEKMAYLCKESPVAIALDEELISHCSATKKQQLINEVLPQYIILKPSLHGSFTGCNEWISAAKYNNVDWWITSALESNIGLNIIAQWTATLGNNQYQGLGTGQLYTNNFASPLFIKEGQLRYDKNLE